MAGLGILVAGLVVSMAVVARPASAETVVAEAGRVGISRDANSPKAPRLAIQTVPDVPTGSRMLGLLPSTNRLDVTVTLKPPDPVALHAFATSVSTPGTALYKHYLTPDAFGRKFGPSTAESNSVRRALIDDGLDPGRLSSNHLSFQLHDARVATLARAFGTTFSRYRLAGGQVAYANTSVPTLPGALGGAVQSVIGLDDLARPQAQGWKATGRRVPVTAGSTASQTASIGPQPCPAATSTAESDDSLTSDQLASAYGLTSLYGAGDLGAGQTIGVFELASSPTADIATFQACYGTSVPISYVKVDSGSVNGPGSFEAALDVEGIISLAPAAKLVVYQGPASSMGEYDTFSSMITQDRDSVISASWGECETADSSSFLNSENTLFEEAATQGQSVVAASGDTGSEDCEAHSSKNTSLSVDEPAAQPFVTAAGGTTITSLGPPPTETTWDVDGRGSGGGISAYWAMPSYQSNATTSLGVVNRYSSSTPCGTGTSTDCRQIPDVSAASGPTYVVYYSGEWSSGSGTSFAAPQWASLLALANASSACNGNLVGFANPALYSMSGTDYSADFNDVTSGNNDVAKAHGGLYPAGPGYDLATGLGSPRAQGLAATLCADATVHVPGPPSVGVVSAGNGRVSVAFSGPVSSGGSPVVSYAVTAVDSTSGGNGGEVVSGRSSPLTVTGLTNGDSYTFTVTATNVAGTGASSRPSGAVTPLAVVTGTSLRVVPSPAVAVVVADGGSDRVVEVAANGSQSTVGSGLSGPSGVAVDAAGDVFVADTGNGRVVEVAANGSQSVVGSGLSGPSGVAVDAAGDVFVADTGNGRVVEVAANGSQSVVGSGFESPEGVAVDAAGDVFVADTGNGRVVEVAANGSQSVVGSGFESPEGVAVDAAGDVFVADTGNGRVVEVAARTASETVVGAGFVEPVGVGVDAAGDVFVADLGAAQTDEVPAGGGSVSTVGSGFAGPVGVGVSAPPAAAGYGSSVALVASVVTAPGATKPTGTVKFVAGATVLGTATVNASGTASLSTTKLPVGTDGVTAAYQGAGIDAASAPSAPATVIVNPVVPGPPSVGVVSAGNGRVSVAFSGPVSSGGSPVVSYAVTAVDSTSGGNGGEVVSGRSSPLTVTGLTNGDSYTFTVTATNVAGTGASSRPSGAVTPLAVVTGTSLRVVPSPAVAVVVADGGSDRVVEVAANGSQSTVGSGFESPEGVAVDAAGDVFVADTGNGRVVEVAANGSQSVVGSGFESPEGVAVDAAGDVFVADTGNGRVVEVAANGSQSVVGSGFESPEGVAVDAAGDVFVADTGNGRVVEVAANGSQSVVGSGFESPEGVAVDAAGDVFVADTGNGRVVEVAARTASETVVGAGFVEPVGVGVDAAGDVFVADLGAAQTDEVPAGGGSVSTVGSGFAGPVGVGVSAPPAAAGYGSSVALVASVVTAPGATKPTGTVKFVAGATVLGTATVNASGTASLSTTKLPVGTDGVTAAYQGAGIDAASAPSAPATVIVTRGPGSALPSGFSREYHHLRE